MASSSPPASPISYVECDGINHARPDDAAIHALYQSVGWTAYTDDLGALSLAIQNSTYVAVAQTNGVLVGLIRALSDDVSILYVQDLLVVPDFQQQGIGRQLLANCLDRYAHVRQHMLLTDNEPHQHRLYQSAGFSDVATLAARGLHAFVNISTRSKPRDSPG